MKISSGEIKDQILIYLARNKCSIHKLATESKVNYPIINRILTEDDCDIQLKTYYKLKDFFNHYEDSEKEREQL
jgi:hypothetical protein